MVLKERLDEQRKAEALPVCIICFRNCDRIIPGKKIYCDLCLPIEYIKKPVGLWLCKKCAKRKLKNDRG